ncbi:MAG: nitrate reductase molybdenum cofactor assembly chaperone, partial [Bradyrhizobium sp.]
MTILFKAFSALLSYPSADMRAALPEIAEIVRTSPLVGQRERQDLLALIDELSQGDLLTVEQRYVDLFDRGRALSLNLFEHLHGESRDRGTAMVDLKRLYEAAGFELATRELPDYLPVVLEYLGCREIGEARVMLADCAHIMQTIARSLIARQSRYAAVPQALIAIAGERPVDSTGIKPV